MYTHKLATCIQADMSVSIQEDKDHTLLLTEQRQGLTVFTKVCQAVCPLECDVPVWVHVLVCTHPCVSLYCHASIWCLRFVSVCLKWGYTDGGQTAVAAPSTRPAQTHIVT